MDYNNNYSAVDLVSMHHKDLNIHCMPCKKAVYGIVVNESFHHVNL